MPTNFLRPNSSGSQLADIRHKLALRILSALTNKFSQLHPYIAIFLIGSSSHNLAQSPKDLDLLLVDIESAEPRNEAQLRRLLECMRFGDPFAGAFDATDVSLRNSFDQLIHSALDSQSSIQVDISFAFGPAKGEIAIPDTSLHIHVAGPLTKADLRTFDSLFPFHALDFLQNHKSLIGPPLCNLIRETRPSIYDLTFWDEILLRRFNNAPTDAVQRKWLTRIIQHRMVVPAYVAKHSPLLKHCSSAVDTSDSDGMRKMIQDLIISAKVIAESSLQQPQG